MVRDLPVDPHTLLAMLAGAALVGNLLWVFARHSVIGVVLLLAVQVGAEANLGQPVAFNLGVHIYPGDIVAVCASLVGLARLVRHGLPPRSGLLPLLAVVALTGRSVLYGAATFGLSAAGNDSRTYFSYVFAAALYISTAPLSAALGRSVTRAWLASATAFTVLCLASWARHGLHPVTVPLIVHGMAVDPRPLSAAASLVLAQAAALLMCPLGSDHAAGEMPARPNRARVLAAVTLLVIVVLLQDRTVWVAAAAMAATWWVLRPFRAGRRIVSAAAGGLTLSLVVLAYFEGAFGSVGGILAASAEETQKTHSTFAWRVIGWQNLLNTPRSLTQWLIGEPFGSGYDRYIGGGLVTVSPHNYFLQVALRVGVIGLAVLLTLYILIWRRLARSGPEVLALRLVLVGQLVFFVAYPAFPEQGVLLGWCLWELRRRTSLQSLVPQRTVGRLDAAPAAADRLTLPVKTYQET